jgi:hypothetical protein
MAENIRSPHGGLSPLSKSGAGASEGVLRHILCDDDTPQVKPIRKLAAIAGSCLRLRRPAVTLRRGSLLIESTAGAAAEVRPNRHGREETLL